MHVTPSYDGKGLVNLVAEIESRLIGAAAAPTLSPELAAAIPDGPTYVVVLFDGLGAAQLEHESAAGLQASLGGILEAGFPTTTSVSLATVATGLPPAQHGVIAHLSWMPEHDRVVNTLKWVDMTGRPVAHDYPGLLPRPNLWERLRAAGKEPITIQPGDFSGSPLTRTLYRGARFEPIWDHSELVDATVQLATVPGRLILTYVPNVDVAGHVFGLDSTEYAAAMKLADSIWDQVRGRLPPDVVLLGTADHGLIGFDEDAKQLVREPSFEALRVAGDPRGVQLWCDDALAAAYQEFTGGTLVDPAALIGPDPEPTTLSRLGRQVLLAAPGRVILPPGFDKRLKAYHGGLDRDEVEIPLLVG